MRLPHDDTITTATREPKVSECQRKPLNSPKNAPKVSYNPYLCQHPRKKPMVYVCQRIAARPLASLHPNHPNGRLRATGTTRNPFACRGFLVVLVERRLRQSSATTVIYLISVMADVCQPIRYLTTSKKINGTSLCGNQAGVYWRKEIFSISVAPMSISVAEDFFSLVHFCNQR